jgi:integrase/recombinase XerD
MDTNETIVSEWEASLRAQSPHTARSYAEAVRRFLAEVRKPITKLTVRDGAAYVGSLADGGLSRASVAHHISAVRSFLRHCQGLGLIPQTPLDAMRRPRVAITSMNRYLTEDEANRLVKAAGEVSPRARVAVAVMLLTGVRVAELAQAEWRHLFADPHGNIGLLVLGKGNKERAVAIRPDLWKLIREDRQRRGLADGLSAKDRTPLLADRRATRYSTVGIWKLVRAAAERAGIDKPLSPHWLRHTFGTLAALGGASPFQIQQDMGHAQITTSQRYVHWARGLEDSAAHAIPVRI